MVSQSTADRLQIVMENLENFNKNLKLKVLSADELSVLTKHHLNYLQAIAEMGNPTFGELAAALNVTKPSVTSIVNKLMSVDFISKTQSKDDKRIFYIRLTKKGKRVMESYNKAYSSFLSVLVNTLEPAEMETLDKLVHKLSDQIDSEEVIFEENLAAV